MKSGLLSFDVVSKYLQRENLKIETVSFGQKLNHLCGACLKTEHRFRARESKK